MSDETGRVEAAAAVLDEYGFSEVLHADCDEMCFRKASAREGLAAALAAADRFDREHGIARIKLDGELRRSLLLALAAADSQNLVGVDLGHTAETMYGALSDAVLAVLRVLREAAEHA